MINHPLLANLEAIELREVRRHVQMFEAFDALFAAAAADHRFSKDVMGNRMQLIDMGKGWARFRDREEKAVLMLDLGERRAVIADERWTPQLLAIYRGEVSVHDAPTEEDRLRRERVRACAWYVRKSPALAGVYKTHRRRTAAGARTYASMTQTLAHLMAEDCPEAEAQELASAAGDVLHETLEDCVIEDMSARQLEAFRADPTFPEAVALGRQYLDAQDTVEKALASVRLGRWAREIEDRGFSPDANAFALARDEAAKLLRVVA